MDISSTRPDKMYLYNTTSIISIILRTGTRMIHSLWLLVSQVIPSELGQRHARYPSQA